MNVQGSEFPGTAVDAFSDAVLPRGEGQHGSQNYTGRDGRAFEVGDFAAAAACRERFSGHIEARKAAHAAAYKVDERYGVPAAVEDRGISQRGGGATKTEDTPPRNHAR